MTNFHIYVGERAYYSYLDSYAEPHDCLHGTMLPHPKTLFIFDRFDSAHKPKAHTINGGGYIAYRVDAAI